MIIIAHFFLGGLASSAVIYIAMALSARRADNPCERCIYNCAHCDGGDCDEL